MTTHTYGPFALPAKRIGIHHPGKDLAHGANIQFLLLGQTSQHITIQVVAMFPGGDIIVLFEKITLEIQKYWKEYTKIITAAKEISTGDDSHILIITELVNKSLGIDIRFETKGVKFFFGVRIPSDLHESNFDAEGETCKHSNHIIGLFQDTVPQS